MHVKRPFKVHVHLIPEKDDRVDMKNNINILQACQSKVIFNKALELFLAKWEATQVNFIKYLAKQWLAPQRNGWYQGFTVGIPDHNNNKETDNRYIKEG